MRVAVLLALLLALAPRATHALDLDEVRCACADGARTTGDYVACLSQMTRRLVTSGQLSAAERARLVRRAARAPRASGGDCFGSGIESLAPFERGWAVMTDAAVIAPGTPVAARFVYWNESPDDVSLDFSSGGERGCLWDLRLVNERGAIVHQVASPADCTAAMFTLVVASGERWERAVPIPTVTQAAETGEPDGVALPVGLYWLEAITTRSWGSPAPNLARARIPIRIE